MFPILICEDDSRQLEQITQIIKQYCAIYQGRFEIALATSNSAKLLEYINEYNIQGGTNIIFKEGHITWILIWDKK